MFAAAPVQIRALALEIQKCVPMSTPSVVKSADGFSILRVLVWSDTMGGRGGSYSRSGFLGPRGKQKTVDEALAGSNPHYREGREWQQNCQRCIYAYEMQRRGYDVEALPRIFDGFQLTPLREGRRAGGERYVYGGCISTHAPA